MLQKEFIMGCKQGFHLRPAQVLMEAVTGTESEIMLKKNDTGVEADAKSMLGLMSLGIEHGETVTVTVNGSDERKVMDKIRKLFETNFGE